MSGKQRRRILQGSFWLSGFAAALFAGGLPVTTTFTYQGTLLDEGVIPTGSYDFVVSLFDSPTDPAAITSPLFFENVAVSEGLFQLPLDYGSQFVGERRWIQIGVRDGSSIGDHEPLLPRQELTSTPYAQFALFSHWNGLFGTPEGFDDDVDNDALVELDCADGEVAIYDGAGFDCATFGGGGGGGWQLTGNAGTIPGTHFLGTTDGNTFELRVNNTRALLVEPVNAGLGGHVNLVGGVATFSTGLNGITVAGGGLPASPNIVFSNVSTIGGGFANEAGTSGDPALTSAATVAGGNYNKATAGNSTIGGGIGNTASGNGATIAGGNSNTASGISSFIGGGLDNEARGDLSVIAGGGAPSALNLGNIAHDHFTVIGGGALNEAGGDDSDPATQTYATVAGGQSNRAQAFASVICGGRDNVVSAPLGFIGGGGPNDDLVADGNRVYGDYGFVGGGTDNLAGSPASEEDPVQTYATIGGGLTNRALRQFAFIGGGKANYAIMDYAVIGGGENNQVSGAYGVIAGGGPYANESFSVPGNFVADGYGSIGGGAGNTAGDPDPSPLFDALFGTVAGGLWNTTFFAASVGGGNRNQALGDHSTVPGGLNNIAQGANSFAAGSRAHALSRGSFVWSDDSDTAFVISPGVNSFSIQAEGGIWFGTDRSPSIRSGAFLDTSTGGYLSTTGDWTNSSDRNRKQGFSPVDGGALLAAVQRLPLTTWTYIGDPTAAKHLGPMAQDFKALFGLGRDEISISTIDASGVALAAVQELIKRTDELTAAMKAIEALESRLAALEAGGSHP